MVSWLSHGIANFDIYTWHSVGVLLVDDPNSHFDWICIAWDRGIQGEHLLSVLVGYRLICVVPSAQRIKCTTKHPTSYRHDTEIPAL